MRGVGVTGQFIEESKQSNQDCFVRMQGNAPQLDFAVILRVGEHTCGRLQSSAGSLSSLPSSLRQVPPFNQHDEYLCYSTLCRPSVFAHPFCLYAISVSWRASNCGRRKGTSDLFARLELNDFGHGIHVFSSVWDW